MKESLRVAELELVIGKQLAGTILRSPTEISHRVAKMRRKFAEQYGFVIPEVKITDGLGLPGKNYQIRLYGTTVAGHELRIGELLVVTGDGRKPNVPSDEVREPAFGLPAVWVSDAFATEVRREGFAPVDNLSVVLTHLAEVIRNNLPQLLSYKDMRALVDRLEPEYKRLVEEICPSQISFSGLQAVLKLLLAERISIRNLKLILEAVAEIVPHARRSEQVAEHVRMRIAQQICGDLAEGGVLNVLRLGNRWDLAFHQSLKRDGKGDVVEFDIDPRLVEQFGTEASAAIRERMRQNQSFVVVTAPDSRPYVRMIVERMFPSLPVLSHVEIARGRRDQVARQHLLMAAPADVLLSAFLVFCRVGGCILIAPGFSSSRIPATVRLYIAVAVSLALAPTLYPSVLPLAVGATPASLFSAIASESAIGLLIGLLGRLFFLALQSFSVVIAQSIGLGGMPGAMVDEGEQLPALSTLLTTTATVMLFVTDQHWELLRGLVASYGAMPPSRGFLPQFALVAVTDQLADAFLIALRVASPFIVFSIIVNLAAGLVNKLTPAVPIFFVAVPFFLAGGMLLLLFTVKELLAVFGGAVGSFLVTG